MSATVADVTLSLNLLSLQVDLYSSVSSSRTGTGLSNFCLGGVDVTIDGVTTKVPAHELTKTVAPIHCPTCKNADATTFTKGKKKGKGWVVVPAETVAEADAVSDVGEGMDFTYHPAAEVDAQTIAVDSPYYVGLPGPLTVVATGKPSTPAKVYALLAQWIAENPDVALLTRFAPRTSVATFRLTARGGMLMLQKLCFPQDMQAAPAIPAPVVDALGAQLDGMIRSQVEDFDPASWGNRRKELLAAYADGQADTAVSDVTEPALATVVDIAELIKRSTPKAKPAARKPRVAKSA